MITVSKITANKHLSVTVFFWNVAYNFRTVYVLITIIPYGNALWLILLLKRFV